MWKESKYFNEEYSIKMLLSWGRQLFLIRHLKINHKDKIQKLDYININYFCLSQAH